MRGLILSLPFCIVSLASAQPSISITPANIDFGRVGPRGLDSSLVITNTGADTLILERPVTSCGCTAAMYDRRTVAPGERFEFRIGIDAKRKNGDVRTSITVKSNDPLKRSLLVPLHAIVVRDIEAPEVVGPATGAVLNVPHEVTLSLRNTSSKPMRITSPVISKSDGLVANVGDIDITIPAGEAASIPVQVTASKEGVGSATLELSTSSDVQPTISMGIYSDVARATGAMTR